MLLYFCKPIDVKIDLFIDDLMREDIKISGNVHANVLLYRAPGLLAPQMLYHY